MAAPLSHPKPLRSGDRVRLVAASSALETGERLQLGMEVESLRAFDDLGGTRFEQGFPTDPAIAVCICTAVVEVDWP